jgi:hypothetical protein
MTITNDWVKRVTSILKTAQTLNISKIIIEPDCIRGIDDDRLVVIFHNHNEPALSIGTVAINSVDDFLERYIIIFTGDNPVFEVVTENGYISQVLMRNDDVTDNFKCENPNDLSVPKKINDESAYRIKVSGKTRYMMKKALAAMKSEIVYITSDKEGVFFKVFDIDNAEFTHRFADNADNIKEEGADAYFQFAYPVDSIISAIQSDDAIFDIGAKGIIFAEVNGLNTLILPQV